jgi:nitrogen fixation/metabolism regulation signal transduction histidine kinase
MKLRPSLITLLALVASAALVFQFFQRRLSDAAFAFTVHPEVLTALEGSLDDQKALARLDPDHEASYRQRFGEVETTLHRLQILDHSREQLVKRYNTILLVVFAANVLVIATISVIRQSRFQPRLARLQKALSELANGRVDIEVGERGRDTVGRIAAMIEQASRVMARDRRRLAALDNLSTWQEAARRHAHEMKTPLTGARLELERIDDLLAAEYHEEDSELRRAAAGVVEELDRLGRFADEFTSFARLPRPELRCHELDVLLREFTTTFRQAWPNVALELEAEADIVAAVDRNMLRQVLVNLCDNVSQAIGDGNGTVALRLRSERGQAVIEVADDGPGIAEDIRPRIFEPYTTTRTIGEGMGLGLAISKKILLDHGGDLELVGSSPRGSTFRLTIPTTELSTEAA